MDSSTHSLHWWFTKVSSGLLLIMLVFEHALIGYLPVPVALPPLIGQSLVLCGGLITIIHYIYVLRRTRKLSEPDRLITAFGLFRYIRHPMYTGDLIIYTGLTLLAPGFVSVFILCVGVVAIWRQAMVEDRYMEDRFGEQHHRWQKETALLVPFIS